MIFLGYDDDAKRAEIMRYQAAHDIRKTIVISADDFPLPVNGTDQIKYSDVIMYVTFYRLLQKIDSQTLVVVNECLRTQNRYDLTYNCIRNFLNQTNHQLIFQLLPQIDERDDFMVLFDFDTRSRWKRRGFDADLIARESRIAMRPLPLSFSKIIVPTTTKTKEKYACEREKLFREIGNRDPHVIPRNLYLIGGADKSGYIQSQSMPLFGASGARYVARNKRLGLDCIVTYEQVERGGEYALVELPHRFIDFEDFVKRTGQTRFQVLCVDLKVDEWYFERYVQWSERLNDTFASLSQ